MLAERLRRPESELVMVKRFNRYLVPALCLFVFGLLGSLNVRADFGTNVTDIVDNASTLFGSVQTLVITIVGFGIAIWVVNKLRRR